MEIWKEAKWHETVFFVSSEGRVKREYNGRSKVLKPFMNGTRAKIKFTQNGHTQYVPIAILIASAFIPNPYNRDYVEHIDGNPQNNKPDNLKWSEMSNRDAWNIQMSKGQLKGGNQYYYDGNLAYVRTSNTDNTIICDKDFWENHKQYTWFEHERYACARVNKKMTKMHRLIVDCPDNYVVDHINRNTLDNRKANLRVTTQCVNTINRGASPLSSTGVKGVYKEGKKYRADISVKKKRLYLGIFNTFEEAIEAREKAERKYHDLIIEKETLH